MVPVLIYGTIVAVDVALVLIQSIINIAVLMGLVLIKVFIIIVEKGVGKITKYHPLNPKPQTLKPKP